MIHVPDEGPSNARLVLIGEAPGRHEELHGRPFVGPSGGRIEHWWSRVGLRRSDFYITNVLDYQPKSIERVSRDEMEEAFEALWARLRALDDLWIIVPTGNYALYALTGKGKVSWHRRDGRHERPGIKSWRGSIMGVTLRGQTVKVIPTIHPKEVLRGQPQLERYALADWQRIKSDLRFRELNLPEREHVIKPTIEDVETYAHEVLTAKLPVAFDIETPRKVETHFLFPNGEWRPAGRGDASQVVRYKSGKHKGEAKTKRSVSSAYIGCIGFANGVLRSLTIPTTQDYWGSLHDYKRALAAIKAILAGDVELVAQNGMFDTLWLRREGFPIRQWLWDTRAMHHCLDPRADHDLASMASLYTRQPYWKDEAKDPDEVMKYASNSEALWTYNGIDCCVTLELYYYFRAQLEAEGKLDFYLKHYARMFEPLMDMSMHGVRVDRARMEESRTKLDAEAAVLAMEITERAGMPLVAKSGISTTRLKFYLYGAPGFETEAQKKSYTKLAEQYPEVEPLRLPVQRKKAATGTGRSVTTDEVTLRKLMLKYPKKLSTLGDKLLAHRRNRKMAAFLGGGALDPDDRVRSQFSCITEQGRLASSSNPWDTGTNMQNQDRELRYIYVPDER